MRETKYTVKTTAQFKKDFKLAMKRGLRIELLEDAIAVLAMGGQCVKKPRRVSCPQARNRVQSFSPVTCAPEKILLSPQVCELSAKGGQRVRAGGCIPSVKMSAHRSSFKVRLNRAG